MTNNELNQHIETLRTVITNMQEIEDVIKILAQANPDADEAWADDALKGLSDVISDMAWNLKNLEDKVAEPHPYESLEVTDRV